jgi:copper chaperone CopZ
VENLTLELPALYADHHVLEVRRILQEMPGISEVYASSAYQMVDVRFDPALISSEQIKAGLDAAGYLGELDVPVETNTPAARPGEDLPDAPKIFLRHTAAAEQSLKGISFTQQVPYTGRALWPCPGMGVIHNRLEEVSNG